MKIIRLKILIVISQIFLLFCSSPTPNISAKIVLVPSTRYQTITGWEATAQAGESAFPSLFATIKDTLFDLVVNELGINRLRLEIRSGAENPTDYFSQFQNHQIEREIWRQHWYEIVNDNDDPFVIDWNHFQFSLIDHTIENVVLPLKERIEARGEHLYLNICYVDFGTSKFEHLRFPDEYAELVLATYLHIQKKYGIVPDSWEVILEPDNTANWSAIDIGKVIVATAKRLQTHGFAPAFVTPSTKNTGEAIEWFNELIKIPDARKYISEFSYHRYRGASTENLKAISKIAIKYGIQTSHLEKIGADYRVLHEDLEIGRNSAWAQYTLAWPKSAGSDDGGKYYIINDDDPERPNVELGKRSRFFIQYFRYIKRGAIQIEATASRKEVDPIAFINPDNKYVVVTKVDSKCKISIIGLPSGKYGISYSTSQDSDINLSTVTLDSSQTLFAAIPGRGVITVYEQ